MASRNAEIAEIILNQLGGESLHRLHRFKEFHRNRKRITDEPGEEREQSEQIKDHAEQHGYLRHGVL